MYARLITWVPADEIGTVVKEALLFACVSKAEAAGAAGH